MCRSMMVAGICLMSAAAFAACRPAQPLDAAAKGQAPLKLEAPPASIAPAAKPQPKRATAKAEGKTPAVSNAVASMDASLASTPVTESRALAAKQDTESISISTTITGCLQLRDDGLFQLKDTDGERAPKTRSWKSGFIKKGSARIDVFDPGNRLELGTHAGYRVSISGTLTDRELRARSLHVTSESCK